MATTAITHEASSAIAETWKMERVYSPVEDLAKQGFPLIGGRLDYLEDRPVAALIYQRNKHFINLFVWPSESGSEVGTKTVSRQGYNLSHWTRSGMMYWAASDLNSAELQEFVELVQNQTSPTS